MMFGHIFLYKTKELLRQKWCFGWNFLFPIIMATAFYVGFGELIDSPGVLTKVNVAIVQTQDDSTADAFTDLVRSLSFMDVRIVSDDEAQQLLEDGTVAGILYTPSGDAAPGKPSLAVCANGIDQTILSQFLKSYIANEREMELILATANSPDDIRKAADLIGEDMSFGSDEINLRYDDSGAKQLSPYMHYFFSLIAMASLFASWISTSILDELMASHTEIGKRYECAPVPKSLSLTAGILSGLLTQLLCATCLILYIQYVLKLSFNAPLIYVILLSSVCSVTGIASGVMFGALFGEHPSMNVAVPLLFSMICSFLSGLMVGNMQQIIQVYIPWLNRVNPAALLTDGLDSLCSYGLSSVYWLDMLALLILAAAAIAVSSLILRRKNYASL